MTMVEAIQNMAKNKKTYLFCALLGLYSLGLVFGIFTPDDLSEVEQQAVEIQNQVEGVRGVIEALIASAMRAGVAKVK